MSLLKSVVQESLNHQNPLHRRLLRRKSPSQVGLDTQNGKKDSDGRYKAVSSIQQGIYQAEPTLADQQRKLRRYVNGAQNDEVAFRKAAQAIAR
jgi:hypothetical protein